MRMMMKTHIIISKSLINNIDSDKKNMINEKSFIYGNIKPDILSKYKLKKHYLDESYDMIRNKILYLSSLNMSALEKTFTKNLFSQEVGVVCHFLADFFCVAHSERWEFKHSMKIHIKYESNLTKVAKDYKLKNDRCRNIEDIDEFFYRLYDEYKKNGNFEQNDLEYSTYTCNTVLNYILERIVDNTINTKVIS